MHIDVFVYLSSRLSNFKLLIDLCFEKPPTMYKYENNIISYLYYISFCSNNLFNRPHGRNW